MITREDRETLRLLWDSEDGTDEGAEWREHLNEAQAALVSFWDRQFRHGLRGMLEDGLDRALRMDARRAEARERRCAL